MSDKKNKPMGIPLAIWGDVTEEKVKKQLRIKLKN